MTDTAKKYVQLSTFLKEGTRASHNDAETSDFQHRLASADLSLDSYKAYLGQLYLMHFVLERGLASNEQLAQVAKPIQFQAEFLQRDLAELKVQAADVKPLPSTKKIIERIEQMTKKILPDWSGITDVVLGSKHGAKFIAASIRKKFGFEKARCLYFDPYGTTFQSIWAEFREPQNPKTPKTPKPQNPLN